MDAVLKVIELKPGDDDPRPVRVGWRYFNDGWALDFRYLWKNKETGELLPSKKGVFIPAERAVDIMVAALEVIPEGKRNEIHELVWGSQQDDEEEIPF